MSNISYGSCTSLTSPKFSYGHGVEISPVGGLPNNNDGGCYWEDEGTHGNYADSHTGIEENIFAMCGPKWGSWQGPGGDSQKPNSVGGNKAAPVVSRDGSDARRGTLIPLSGKQPPAPGLKNTDADMWSLCCGDGTDYKGAPCPRGDPACDL